MPYSITTKDGITLNNIPDDVPPDAPDLRQRVADIRAQRGGGQAAQVEAQAVQEPQETQTTPEGVVGAVTRGAGPYAAGAALGALVGAPVGGIGAVPGAAAGAGAVGLAQFVGDPIVGGVNSLLGTNFATPSEALSNLFDRLGVAEPRTAAERVIQTASSAAGGASSFSGVGSSIAKSANPVVAGVGRQLAAQPIAQITGGAGSGVGSQTVAEIGGGPVAQLAGGIVGGITGAGIGNIRGLDAPDVLARQQAIKEAESRGIRVMTTDVLPPKTFVGRSAQVMGERMPVVGTGGMRKTQNIERIRAIRSTLDDFGATDAAKASDDVMADLLKTRGDALSRYSTQKNEVIDKLASRGAVPVGNSTSAIQQEIGKLSNNIDVPEIKSVIDDLNALGVSLQGKDLRALEQQRILLGEKYKAPELASVRGIAEKALAKVYGPLRQDMGEFIKRNGDARDFTKWSVANKRLANLAGELDNSALKSVLRRGDATPEVVQNMLFSKKPSEVRALYSQLSPRGKASARIAILAKAAEKAAYENADGAVTLSPEKFTNEAKRLGSSIDVFFSGQDLRSIRGLIRALEVTRRAGESGVMTKTGQELYGPAALGLGALNWKAALAGGVTTGALARAYESKPVRDLLVKMPSIARGSAEEAEAAKRIISAIQAQSQTKEQE